MAAKATADEGLEDDTTDDVEWAMKAGANNILVVLRVRPMNDKEKRTAEEVVSIMDEKLVVVRDPGHFADNPMRRARMRDRKYAFDHAFGPTCTQMQVYNATTKFLIEGVVNGYNATVFAYGPTGSGKTHTMLGQRSNEGIMVLTMRDLYVQVEAARREGRHVTVTMSLIEVYNETIRDLLAADATEGDYLDLREDPIKGPCVTGVSEHDAETAEDVMELLSAGNKRRTQESTAANKESSRSHAVLQVLVQQKEQYATDVKYGKFSLIDLAGSERASNTQNRGIRLLEGANINRSLLSLGNCITALVQGKGSFVPYRDSKLTRLLKDSLGGNTRTVMIGCISPSSAAFEETINTLKYCDRAKRIKINVTRNVLTVNYHISEYESLIAGLRAEVTALQCRLATIGVSSPHAGMSRPATASGMTASLTGSALASLLPFRPSLSSRQVAAINGAHLRASRGGEGGVGASGGGALGRAGSRLIMGDGGLEESDGSMGEVSGSVAVDREAADRMTEWRQALVDNFQERIQIRRSMAELQAQQVENTVELGKRQVLMARAGQFTSRGEDVGGGSSATPKDPTVLIARREMRELESSAVSNSSMKLDLEARLEANEADGEVIRAELERFGTSEDRRELLALQYRVCLLELEKVELDQSQLLFQRAMQEKDMELKKLRLQIQTRDNLINHQADIIQKANLAHLVDYNTMVAVDAELTIAKEDEMSPPRKVVAGRTLGGIWDGYSNEPAANRARGGGGGGVAGPRTTTTTTTTPALATGNSVAGTVVRTGGVAPGGRSSITKRVEDGGLAAPALIGAGGVGGGSYAKRYTNGVPGSTDVSPVGKRDSGFAVTAGMGAGVGALSALEYVAAEERGRRYSSGSGASTDRRRREATTDSNGASSARPSVEPPLHRHHLGGAMPVPVGARNPAVGGVGSGRHSAAGIIGETSYGKAGVSGRGSNSLNQASNIYGGGAKPIPPRRFASEKNLILKALPLAEHKEELLDSPEGSPEGGEGEWKPVKRYHFSRAQSKAGEGVGTSARTGGAVPPLGRKLTPADLSADMGADASLSAPVTSRVVLSRLNNALAKGVKPLVDTTPASSPVERQGGDGGGGGSKHVRVSPLRSILDEVPEASPPVTGVRKPAVVAGRRAPRAGGSDSLLQLNHAQLRRGLGERSEEGADANGYSSASLTTAAEVSPAGLRGGGGGGTGRRSLSAVPSSESIAMDAVAISPLQHYSNLHSRLASISDAAPDVPTGGRGRRYRIPQAGRAAYASSATPIEPRTYATATATGKGSVSPVAGKGRMSPALPDA